MFGSNNSPTVSPATQTPYRVGPGQGDGTAPMVGRRVEGEEHGQRGTRRPAQETFCPLVGPLRIHWAFSTDPSPATTASSSCQRAPVPDTRFPVAGHRLCKPWRQRIRAAPEPAFNRHRATSAAHQRRITFMSTLEERQVAALEKIGEQLETLNRCLFDDSGRTQSGLGKFLTRLRDLEEAIKKASSSISIAM